MLDRNGTQFGKHLCKLSNPSSLLKARPGRACSLRLFPVRFSSFWEDQGLTESLAISASPCDKSLIYLCGSLLYLLHYAPGGFFCAVDPSQHRTQHSRSVISAQKKGKITLPDLPGISYLMQSRLLLVLSVARVHCWAMVSWLSVPRSSFSAMFLSSWSDPRLWSCIELFLPRWVTWCFSL